MANSKREQFTRSIFVCLISDKKVIFMKPKKLFLVRHGAPVLSRGDNAGLDPERKQLLRLSVEDIEEKLEGSEIGRVVLLSSELRRARETAEYIGEALAKQYVVSEVIAAPLLNLNSKLGGLPGRFDKSAYDRLNTFIAQQSDSSSAVIGTSHQPVIYNISSMAGVKAVEGYGAVTEIY